MEPEDEDRLYREREALRGQEDSCVGDDLTPAADQNPVVPPEKCDGEEEVYEADFLDPNPTPTPDALPDLLPGPVLVSNREVTVGCDADPDQVTISNVDPEYESVVAAGSVSVEFFLDSVEEITQDELFRLADYVPALQSYVDANLIAAIIAADFTTFDQGLVTLLRVSAPIATLIREDLVTAQARADEIATLEATTAIDCGWINKDLWVICDAGQPEGYSISYVDPGAVEKVFIAAGEFTSEIDQADADARAAQQAAADLSCLFTNDTPVDITCNSEGILDESTLLDNWPSNWLTKAPDGDGNAVITTLEEQVGPVSGNTPDSWDYRDWQDLMFNTTALLPLSDLSGQEFMAEENVGTDERRTLITRVVIPVGDPRTVAPTQAEANAIAQTLAEGLLDCFFPNRPMLVACSDPDYGEADPIARAAGAGYPFTTEQGRFDLWDEMCPEIVTEDTSLVPPNPTQRDLAPPTEDPECRFNYLNKGVTDFGGVAENLDTEPSFEVRVWPGFFSAPDEATVEAVAGEYGASLLLCQWISPEQTCSCYGDTATDLHATVADVSLDTAASTDPGLIPCGFIVSPGFPGADFALAIDWQATLLPICFGQLECEFEACKVVCCQPKPDERAIKENGTANWFGNTVLGQTTFMSDWNVNLAAALTDFSPCSTIVTYDSEAPAGTYDGCEGDTSSIYDAGPGSYGAPARFRFGGYLPWNCEWGLPGDDPENPGESLPGRYVSCHTPDANDPGQTGCIVEPDPWGYFHCAEGVARGPEPEGLALEAQSNAQGRVDCTHINWSRVISDCPDSHQLPLGGTFTNTLYETATTQMANQAAEAELLASLNCNDVGPPLLGNFGNGSGDGGGPNDCEFFIPNQVAVFNAGCPDISPGMSLQSLNEEVCDGAVFDGNLGCDTMHVFIEVKPCGDGGDPEVFTPQFIIIQDTTSGPNLAEMQARITEGGVGVPTGRARLAALSAASPDSEFFYVLSVYNEGDNEQLIAQVLNGPIVVKTCGDPVTPAAGDTFRFSIWESNITIFTPFTPGVDIPQIAVDNGSTPVAEFWILDGIWYESEPAGWPDPFNGNEYHVTYNAADFGGPPP